MATFRPRTFWVSGACTVLSALSTPGCFMGRCGEEKTMFLLIDSTEPLSIDDGTLDSSDPLPVLIMEVTFPEYGPDTSIIDLVRAESGDLDLGGGWGGEWGVQESTRLKEITVSFDLQWNERSGSSDDAFPPIEVQGGQPEVVLWNGWTLETEWGIGHGDCG
jgi:hypothetical protein